MKPAKRKRVEEPCSDPNFSVVVCDDGSRTLRCKRRSITWHSESGALTESKLVFLENSAVSERLDAAVATRVLEVGFGTGLNFWLTASLALQRGAALEYVALEPEPLDKRVIDALLYTKRPSCALAMERFSLDSIRQRVDAVELQLWHKEFQQADWSGQQQSFDAIYHDPFSPEVSPELWQKEIFAELFSLLQPGGRLVTYCVKSEVRRRLAGVGFKISKTRGPVGGKREVLIATKPLVLEQ